MGVAIFPGSRLSHLCAQALEVSLLVPLFQEVEGCSFVPGAPACVFWDEEELAWSGKGCSLDPSSGSLWRRHILFLKHNFKNKMLFCHIALEVV